MFLDFTDVGGLHIFYGVVSFGTCTEPKEDKETNWWIAGESKGQL